MSEKESPLEETKRIGRVLEIVQMIALNPRRYLRRDLADHFEVSERTITKDLQVVRHAMKLPLEHSPKGYYIEAIPRLPALQYTLTEALALFRALQVALQSSGIDCQELAAAVARLKALFPREFAPFLDQMTMRPVVLSARKSHRQRMLMLLNQAWIESRKIEMVYETRSRGGARSERVVHPYHVVPYVRSWHMIAYCELRENVLVFKVDRIRSATLLESAFKIPKDFDLERYMGCTWGMMRCEDGADPVDIVLRFEPEAGHWVGEEDWHPSQKVEELSDGSVLFRLRLVITPEFVNWLLYYGNRVKVLEPENLKDQVIEEHRKAMDEY